ncbi:MAG: redoxin domain-containing protein [Candidatus Kariarchaeaceae archaeon]|jgi:peroxiredoxin
MINIGDRAPSVRLKINDSENVNLDFDLQTAYDKGITILYFFPAAFTGICTKSSCELRDTLSDFQELEVQLFGISVDSPFVLKKFHTENNLNYALLSDWNKNAIKAFDVVDDNFAGGLIGFAKRSLFAVKNEQIMFKWVAETPGNYPPFEELKVKLR